VVKHVILRERKTYLKKGRIHFIKSAVNWQLQQTQEALLNYSVHINIFKMRNFVDCRNESK